MDVYGLLEVSEKFENDEVSVDELRSATEKFFEHIKHSKPEAKARFFDEMFKFMHDNILHEDTFDDGKIFIDSDVKYDLFTEALYSMFGNQFSEFVEKHFEDC